MSILPKAIYRCSAIPIKQPTPVLLPGKSHGWRSLVGCSPWGHEESDMTKWLHFHFSLSGKWPPTPMFLPVESQGWWSLVGCHLYGVAQSRTWLSDLAAAAAAAEQIISQFVWKYKKTQIAKAILRKKNGTGEINMPDFRLYYKASHQDSMVLAQRLKYRSMEKNRKPRDKSTHLWTPYLWQRRQEYTTEKRQVFQ